MCLSGKLIEVIADCIHLTHGFIETLVRLLSRLISVEQLPDHRGFRDAAPLGFLFHICGVLFGQPELLFDSFSHNHFSFQVLGQSPNEAFVRPVGVQTHCSPEMTQTSGGRLPFGLLREYKGSARFVEASSISFALSQVAGLTHFAASPLHKKSLDFSGTPFYGYLVTELSQQKMLIEPPFPEPMSICDP